MRKRPTPNDEVALTCDKTPKNRTPLPPRAGTTHKTATSGRTNTRNAPRWQSRAKTTHPRRRGGNPVQKRPAPGVEVALACDKTPKNRTRLPPRARTTHKTATSRKNQHPKRAEVAIPCKNGPPPASKWQSRAKTAHPRRRGGTGVRQNPQKPHATATSSKDDAQNRHLGHRPPTADTPFPPRGRRVSSKM